MNLKEIKRIDNYINCQTCDVERNSRSITKFINITEDSSKVIFYLKCNCCKESNIQYEIEDEELINDLLMLIEIEDEENLNKGEVCLGNIF